MIGRHRATASARVEARDHQTGILRGDRGNKGLRGAIGESDEELLKRIVLADGEL